MPRSFYPLSDGNKLGFFKTEIGDDPDNPEIEIGISEIIGADIASYVAVGNGIAVSNAKLFSIFNKTPKRLRIHKINVIPFVPANNVVFLSLGYINQEPSGGTDGIVSKLAFDYPPNGANPPTLISLVPCKKLPTSPNAVAGVNLGNEVVNLTAGVGMKKQTIFERLSSSIILRPYNTENSTGDGLTIEQVGQTATGGQVYFEVWFALG